MRCPRRHVPCPDRKLRDMPTRFDSQSCCNRVATDTAVHAKVSRGVPLSREDEKAEGLGKPLSTAVKRDLRPTTYTIVSLCDAPDSPSLTIGWVGRAGACRAFWEAAWPRRLGAAMHPPGAGSLEGRVIYRAIFKAGVKSMRRMLYVYQYNDRGGLAPPPTFLL